MATAKALVRERSQRQRFLPAGRLELQAELQKIWYVNGAGQRSERLTLESPPLAWALLSRMLSRQLADLRAPFPVDRT